MTDVHGVMLVVDSTDTMRFSRVSEVMNNFMGMAKMQKGAGGKKVRILVLANKQDLGDAVPAPEVVEGLDLLPERPTTMTGNTWTVQNASAKRGDGIFEAFSWLTQH